MNDPRWTAIRAAVHTHQGMPSLRSLTASTGIPTSTVARLIKAHQDDLHDLLNDIRDGLVGPGRDASSVEAAVRVSG